MFKQLEVIVELLAMKS